MASYELISELTQFILKESRYCDESRYSDWESLWTDDGHYWVPRGPDMDPEKHVSQKGRRKCYLCYFSINC